MKSITLHKGFNLDYLKTLADNSIDSIVTDGPYGLSKEPDMLDVITHWINGDNYNHKHTGFMGKSWDSFVPGPVIWKECYRVLKPDGYLLNFYSARTYDIGVLAIRLAGFEIRDQIMWIYGSGFPKSLNVSKALDKQAGVEREVIGIGKTFKRMIPGNDQDKSGSWIKDNGREYVPELTKPTTANAEKWDGWGTALKPAHEPIVVARKPLIGTVIDNVLKHGTGGINIDGCRVDFESDEDIKSATWGRETNIIGSNYVGATHSDGRENVAANPLGRWPANVIHDGSEEVLAEFPAAPGQQAEQSTDSRKAKFNGAIYSKMNHRADEPSSDRTYQESGSTNFALKPGARRLDTGSAARFFYCAKATRRERNRGLPVDVANDHPTVKPIALVRYLVRLVTPPRGVCLDPYMGSGTTGVACLEEGFGFVGIEDDEHSFSIAQQRINNHTA